MDVSRFIENVYNFIWGIPLVTLILIVGIIYTIKLKGLQFCKLTKAISLLKRSNNKKDGEVSSFQALCISLSATIGTGNIIGVGTALTLGGAGALVWMVISAFLGMATKYAEGFLAIKFRKKEKDMIIGGPYAYIEYGMGKKYKWLAKSFAIFGMAAAIFGLGTFIQVNGITDATLNLFDKSTLNVINIFGYNISFCTIVSSLIITTVSGVVLLGGVKRIASVCEKMVPFMAIMYILICSGLLLFNIKLLPDALSLIIKSAFKKQSLVGGVVGYTVVGAIKQGVSKGIFTNEAGLGSAPIAISESNSNNPVEEGLIAMISTFLGTIIICTLTGLTIVVTNAYLEDLNSIYIIDYALFKGLPFSHFFTSIFILVATICFGFTSIIGWNLYGVKCLNYLFNNNLKVQKIYQIIYILFIFIGSYLEVKLIWNIAEIANGLMAIPNLIALISLKEIVKKDTNDYFKNKK